jgi:hypothetical protein
MHQPPREFRSALSQAETAANALSGAIRAVLDPMLPGSSGARSCGRALGLERTLGWKLWTIAHTSDLATTLKVLPGRRGWTQVAAALGKRGGNPAAIAAMRDAADRLHGLLGDLKRSPALLRAIGAGGLDRTADHDRMVAARRKASRANEKVFGVHAELATVAALLAPGRRKASLALACSAVFDGLTRARPGMPWPLYARLATLDTRNGQRRLGNPIDPRSKLPPIVSGLCRPGSLANRLMIGERDGGAFLQLADLDPADDPLRIAVAEFVEVAATTGSDDVDPVHLRLGNYLPTDLVVFDVAVHASLILKTDPSPWLCGTPLSIRALEGWHEEARLPIECESQEIAPAGLAARLGPAGAVHLELLRQTAAALGTELSEFRLFRVRLPFPPLFGSLFMSFELAPAASGARTRRRERRRRK